MKILHTISPKTNRYYTALVATDVNGKVCFDFDPFKVRLALACCDPLIVRELLESLQLDFPAELLRVSHEWEIELI